MDTNKTEDVQNRMQKTEDRQSQNFKSSLPGSPGEPGYNYITLTPTCTLLASSQID